MLYRVVHVNTICQKSLTKLTTSSTGVNIFECLLICHVCTPFIVGVIRRHRYMNGASTNPDAHVVAYAAAQVKKGLDVAKKLGAENFGNCTLDIDAEIMSAG